MRSPVAYKILLHMLVVQVRQAEPFTALASRASWFPRWCLLRAHVRVSGTVSSQHQW